MSFRPHVWGLLRRFRQPSHSFSISTNHRQSLPELFANPRIHNLLRLITYNNPDVVHTPQFKKLLKDRILMLTDAELHTIQLFSSTFTHQRLQMPPVLSERQESSQGSVIIRDPNLRGLLPQNYKLIFTDISMNESRAKRLIVVREPDGVLRHATASERDRMNQVYFPTPGRRMRSPLMFRNPHLQNLLNRGEYEYVLDRACVQFEPNDADYINLCRSVYEHVNTRSWSSSFSSGEDKPKSINPLRLLRHTRHFGPLALHLIVEFGNPGSLVHEALSCQHFARLGWLLRLVTLLRPSSAFAQALTDSQLDLPPPAEMDANKVTSGQISGLLTTDEIQNLLSYVQLFVDREPMTNDQKHVLMTLVDACREGLDHAHPALVTG